MDIRVIVNELLIPFERVFGDHDFTEALLILATALLLAKGLDWLMRRVIRRFTGSTRIDLDDQIAAAMHRPLFWSVVLIGMLAALVPLGLGAAVIGTAQKLVLTVLALMWALFLMRVARLSLKAASDHQHDGSLVRAQTLPLFENLALVLVIGLAVFLVFRVWAIDMTAWLASAGIVGIAVGFAAKDTLANLFAGVFILADAPYKIGDFVVLDNGSRGEITHIGIRSTRLRTKSDVEVTIPNSIMGNTMVTNESGGRHEKFRIQIPIGVAYGSDIDQVREVLLEIGTNADEVCAEPAPRVRFRTFGASGLDFELLCWVDRPQIRGRVVDALNTAIYKRFMDEGIEIPYPKQDLYVKQMPDGEQG